MWLSKPLTSLRHEIDPSERLLQTAAVLLRVGRCTASMRLCKLTDGCTLASDGPVMRTPHSRTKKRPLHALTKRCKMTINHSWAMDAFAIGNVL